VAMTLLARRLAKLEGRFDVGSGPIEHVIRFVDVDGTVVSTLTLTHGRQEWSNSPGHAPAESESQVSA
jgi:hypothetical protein